MGISTSVLTQEDIQRLKKETDLKTKDIKKIHKKFGALDKEKKGYVNINDLVEIPEIEQNPLRYYIAQYMSNNTENEAISFEAFIKIIDMFKNNKTEEQYKLMFNLFDFDRDGKISSEFPKSNLKLINISSLELVVKVNLIGSYILSSLVLFNKEERYFLASSIFVKFLLSPSIFILGETLSEVC